MISRSSHLLIWLLNLFNPPPLESLGRAQKIGRAFFLTLTVVVGSILMAMLGAVGIFVVQRGGEMLRSVPELMDGLVIILAGGCVNGLCVWVLLQIKRADSTLMPPRTKTSTPLP